MSDSNEGDGSKKCYSLCCKFISQFMCSLGTFWKIVVINAHGKLRESEC